MCTLLARTVFLTILLYAHAHIVKIPLYRSSMRASRLGDGNLKPNLVDSTPKQLALVEEILIVNASFGEPPQFCNLTLDTSNSYTTLFPTKPGPVFTSAFRCYDKTRPRHWFQPCASRTALLHHYPLEASDHGYVLLSQPYSNDCGFDAIANRTGKDVIQDTLSVGNLTLTSTPVVALYNWHGLLNPDWPSDGIFGIRRDFSAHRESSTNANNSALERILTAFDGHNTTATIVLNSGPALAATELGGWLTFGGTDGENCEDHWFFLDSTPTWELSISSFNLGDVYHDNAIQGPIITSSAFVRLPQLFFDKVVVQLKALYDFDSDTYFVDCGGVSELPALTFSVGDDNAMFYNVPATDYARRVYSGLKDRCHLMLSPQAMIGYASTSDYLSLGTTFMRSHCILLDYSNGKVAVAEKKVVN